MNDASKDDCDKSAISEIFQSESEIGKLKRENEYLKKKLLELELQHEGQLNNSVQFTDACSQTDFVPVKIDLKELKEQSCNATTKVADTLTAESIAQTAQSVLNSSGWVYDEQRGIYFDYNTNLYYYPSTRLYYNYKNGCYYKYNNESQKYEFQYQLEGFKSLITSSTQGCSPLKHTYCFTSLKKATFDFGFHNRFSTIKRSDVSTSRNIEVSLNNFTDTKTGSSQQDSSSYDVNSNAVQESVSDSEVECITPCRRKYLVCKICTSLAVTDCCKDQEHSGKKSDKISMNYAKLDIKGLESSHSDSEIETLTTNHRKYKICKKCRSIVISTCCGSKRKPHKRKQQISEDDSTRKKLFVEQSDYSSPNFVLSPLSKGKVEYSMDCNNTDMETTVDLESDINVIPCIRAMVTSSKGLTSGTLFIITCQGATLGSGEDCEIPIQENGVNEKHAAISYNHQQKNYFVTDFGSEAGTTLNSTTEHNPGSTAVLQTPITHKSVLLIGDTVIVLHLHLGYETCDDCEPGQIQALLNLKQVDKNVKFLSREEKEEIRRSELKSIKKRYNLHNDKYMKLLPIIGPQYVDRASERRLTKGSDNPYEKDEMPTSFQIELSDNNKGHQMLKKMGWSKGQSLGKSQDGIKEPIVPDGRSKGKYGLGFGKIG